MKHMGTIKRLCDKLESIGCKWQWSVSIDNGIKIQVISNDIRINVKWYYSKGTLLFQSNGTIDEKSRVESRKEIARLSGVYFKKYKDNEMVKLT